MRRLLFYLAIFIVSVLVGLAIVKDPGYVLIARQAWSIEMPLWAAIALLIGGIWIGSRLIRLFRHTRAFPQRWRHRKHRHQQRKTQQLTQQGLTAFARGEWQLAHNKLTKAVSNVDDAWLHYITAAFAAHKLTAYEQRDHYLQHPSHTKNTHARVLAGLLQAYFYLQQQQPQLAISLLLNLQKIASKQPYVLQLLTQAYQVVGDWQGIINILPNLYRYKIFSSNQLQILEVTAYQHLLQQWAGADPSERTLKSNWQRLPSSLQLHPTLVATYAQLLVNHGANKAAEKLLLKTLNQNWNERLIRHYGELITNHPDEQLHTLETWLVHHPEDNYLLLTLGKLCLRNQLWGKARSYLESSLALKPTAEAYELLGKLLEKLEEEPASILVCYKKALELANTPIISWPDNQKHLNTLMHGLNL